MGRSSALGIGLAVALIAAVSVGPGCTRTVYVVQNPDGTLTQIKGPEERYPGHGSGSQTTHLVDGDALVIDILQSSEYLLVDGDEPLLVQVTLEGKEVEVIERAPFNLAIVLDRSGSMTGTKMTDAQAAAHALVDGLADGDRVALVSYATDVSVDVQSTIVGPQTRALLARAIDSLEPAGGTFLSGGMEAGAGEVRRRYDAEALNRVILVSDGRANVGVTGVDVLGSLADSLRAQGVSVTTMGIGADYHEDLMTTVAIAGGGNYYYVEHSHALSGVFRDEIGGLGATIVRDAVLELQLPAGVTVREVYGYRHTQRGRTLEVYMSSVSAKQKRRVLMALDVPRQTSGQRVVARGKLSYRDERAKTQRSLTVPPIAVSYTRDRRLAARSVDNRVVEKLEAVRNAQARRQALKQLDRGDRAAAARTIATRIEQGRRAGKATGSASIATQTRDLERLASDVKSAPAPTTKAYRQMKKARKAEAYRLDAF